MGIEQMEKKLKNLETLVNRQAIQIKGLENQIRVLEDIQEITKLQRIYGHYLEHWMVDEIVDCFSDSPEVALYWLEGTWRGKAGVRRYFQKVENKDARTIHQIMQISGVIDVDADGKKARGRWYGFGAMFIPKKGDVERSLDGGIYENEYVKEDGRWKILTFRWMIPYSVKVSENNWLAPEQIAKQMPFGSGVRAEPDVPLDSSDQRYVSGYIFPFHYKHPVTGKQTSEAAHNARLRNPINK